jgi:hypothetical protein
VDPFFSSFGGAKRSKPFFVEQKVERKYEEWFLVIKPPYKLRATLDEGSKVQGSME